MKNKHLTTDQAIVEYRQLKEKYPNKIINLKKIDCCDHWVIEIIEEEDKIKFLKKELKRQWGNLIDDFFNNRDLKYEK